MSSARSIYVRGVVQGVGFRPFVHQLAHANELHGWVLNEEHGVELHIEGPDSALDSFIRELRTKVPPAACVVEIQVHPARPAGCAGFTIRESRSQQPPSARISADLPVCPDCLCELFDPEDPRYRYPYINCTHCGPRYSVLERLPYDRPNTTMKAWPLDAACEQDYHNPASRRFHAQPVACPACGPHYDLLHGHQRIPGDLESVGRAAELLRDGGIVAIKGLGGYHLACDAANFTAVAALRERKFRKERPFAVMVRAIEDALRIVHLSPESEALLTSPARPIVLAPAVIELAGVAPDNHELGVMLAYTPLHHLLFSAGAPGVLVMTSANRSSEPIAYRDEDALERLGGIADAVLIGERPIARRVDDSVARAGVFGPMILRRSRGYAPGAVTMLPYTTRPILAVGADLKNTVALAVRGQIFVSQHVGDLEHYQAREAFRETIDDLCAMYEIDRRQLIIAHDLHPQYASTVEAQQQEASEHYPVQHHRAHIASVLAEREAWELRVVGVSLDGTGYGDDGTIWGGEFFAGSLTEGFQRIGRLRPARLPGGDAAARFPVQSAAGFLAQMDRLPDLAAPPFHFPIRYHRARQLLDSEIRSFFTTSIGRLFDAAAALLGFTGAVSFEGQAAMWVEQLARRGRNTDAYPFPLEGSRLDFRPLLEGLILDRCLGREPVEAARAFQRAVSAGISAAIRHFCAQHSVSTAVLSGGVFQNELLLEDVKTVLANSGIRLWTNSLVPPNDGGISLGQVAMAAFQHLGARHA